MNLYSINRRLDRLDADEQTSIGDTIQQGEQDHEARRAAWTAAGHAGESPGEQLPALESDASAASRRLWRQMAEGRARVIHGTAPEGSPFASLKPIYAMGDDDLLAAINAHPLYAGWPEYRP